MPGSSEDHLPRTQRRPGGDGGAGARRARPGRGRRARPRCRPSGAPWPDRADLDAPYEAALRAGAGGRSPCRAARRRRGGPGWSSRRPGPAFAELGAAADARPAAALAAPAAGRRPPRLSPRELQVLRLVATGRSTARIAEDLVPERAHRRPARQQHLRQAARVDARRGDGLRLRARADRRRGAWVAGPTPAGARGWSLSPTRRAPPGREARPRTHPMRGGPRCTCRPAHDRRPPRAVRDHGPQGRRPGRPARRPRPDLLPSRDLTAAFCSSGRHPRSRPSATTSTRSPPGSPRTRTSRSRTRWPSGCRQPAATPA